MDQGFLKYGNSKIYFHRFGQGEKLLIALHGFGDQSAMFLNLEESLKESYTIYSIDLPFHGQTEWAKSFFNRADINAIFKIILEKENKEHFELMGFSLGGRIVLKSLFDDNNMSLIKKVYLIAPDGLKTKGMFNANLVPNWFKRILKGMLNKPEWLIKIAAKFYQWKIIDSFLYSFINHHLRTAEKRDRLFYTWYSLKDFLIPFHSLKQLLEKHKLPVKLYFGIRDKVIPLSAGEKLSKDLPNVELYTLDESHRMVGIKLNKLLKEQLR